MHCSCGGEKDLVPLTLDDVNPGKSLLQSISCCDCLSVLWSVSGYISRLKAGPMCTRYFGAFWDQCSLLPVTCGLSTEFQRNGSNEYIQACCTGLCLVVVSCTRMLQWRLSVSILKAAVWVRARMWCKTKRGCYSCGSTFKIGARADEMYISIIC